MFSLRNDGLYGNKWHRDYLARLFAEHEQVEGTRLLIEWDPSGEKEQKLLDPPAWLLDWIVQNSSVSTMLAGIKKPFNRAP